MSAIARTEGGVLVSVPVDLAVHEVARRMAMSHTGAALVVDGDNRPIGIVTERDLSRRMVAANLRPSEHTVGNIMSRPAVVLIEGQSSVDDALRLMARHHLRHLPLMDPTGKPIGMVSLQRLLHHRLEQLEHENVSLAAFIGADGVGGD